MSDVDVNNWSHSTIMSASSRIKNSGSTNLSEFSAGFEPLVVEEDCDYFDSCKKGDRIVELSKMEEEEESSGGDNGNSSTLNEESGSSATEGEKNNADCNGKHCVRWSRKDAKNGFDRSSHNEKKIRSMSLGRGEYGSPLILGGLQKMPPFEKKRFDFDLYAGIGIIRFLYFAFWEEFIEKSLKIVLRYYTYCM